MKMKIICFLIIAIGCLRVSIGNDIEEKQVEKKVVYFLPFFWGNEIFNVENKNHGACYHLEPFHQFYSTAEKAGYDLRIADGGRNQLTELHKDEIKNSEDFDSIVVFDVNAYQLSYLSKYPKKKLILFLWEPPTVLNRNYTPNNHQIFDRVYTWRDDLVDNKKYFKIYYPVLRPMSVNPHEFEKKKLCVMVAANKFSSDKNELYTERRNLIDFFENNHPDDFDLFGYGGWPESFKTFKGGLENGLYGKVEKLKEGYKFAVAYENGKEIPGYITEKIFDCFTSGTVPIYWGAPNITSYIPKNCFIAREDFKDNEELYSFLTKMTKEQHAEYIKNIQKYLQSDQAKVFSSDHFVKIMMEMLQRPSNGASIEAEKPL